MKRTPFVRQHICVATCAVLAGCYNAAADFKQLAAAHEVAQGQVVHVDCGDHGAVYYSFLAAGAEHRAKAPNGQLNCHSAQRGDKVTVFYDPKNPRTNTVVNPNVAYANAKGWYVPEWLWFIGVPALFVVAITALELSRSKKSKNVRGENGA